MNPVLPNADDPRGGTPMNADDELRQAIMYELDNMDSANKTETLDAIAALLHKSNLQRAIDELLRFTSNGFIYESSSYSISGPELADRIKTLQAELQQVEKGDV